MLLGFWGGDGSFQLRDGTRQRISCNAYYTGGINPDIYPSRWTGRERKHAPVGEESIASH